MRRTWRAPGPATAVFAAPPLLLWMTSQMFGELPRRLGTFPTTSYLVFVTPGIAVVGVIPAALLIGASFFAEREMGIVEHFLAAPISQSAIVLGRLAAALACALISMAVVVVTATLGGFRIDVASRILAVAPLSALLAVLYCALAATLALYVRRRSLLRACMAALLCGSLTISDMLLPARWLPGWIISLANLNPAWYAIEGARAAVASRPDWTIYQHDILMLAIMATILVIVLHVVFRRCGEMQW
jgi:ABC-2 type transport system permease protein